ncbi:onanonoxo-7-onima-8-eninoihtemlysoneda [Stipitochalara longipes BDJ]|nr:onanonoxo-7-onima-8-eninoihtemlysoneda [Stipitochalara longipes BDJ]
MASKASSLWRTLRTYQIYGANTNVGKTIMSTILCKGFKRQFPSQNVWYLKPVSTGPLDEADDRHISRYAPETKTKCLFQFDEAVSPHIAARSGQPLSDSEVRDEALAHFIACSKAGGGTILLETAGGVHSPTPSGSSQADLYRPLRLPICLVADHHLGGISASISAFESLHIRGYDLDTVLQFEGEKYQNHSYLEEYFEKKGVSSLSLPSPPPRGQTEEEDQEMMADYYEKMTKLDKVKEAIFSLAEKHTKRLENLEEMSTRAHDTIWYPFTQHRDVSPQSILTIDAASGDFFQTYNSASKEGTLVHTFDGSASWWTQGLGHGNPELSLAAAYAAGRYGHVMLANTIHEPALQLAESLLSHLNNPRLSKVFYSDNGSTGIEVAMKMALTASFERYKWDIPKEEMGVIGLKGSYHGDTIGAMDASEPSTYNERVHWYKGRGYWFDFPQVKMVKGRWIVEPPQGMESDFGEVTEFASLAEIFDIQARLGSSAGRKYGKYIETTLDRLINKDGKTFGALVMEPLILGAGGMLFADPLFQHLLASTIRTSPLFPSPSHTSLTTWTGLPIIHDEVFTGLYRLGTFTPSTLLQSQPDISVYAKLLTGGLVPLCCTVASQSIFDAFLGNEKRDALLHGHSYTAHPVGCHVAVQSLKTMVGMEKDGVWDGAKEDWKSGSRLASVSDQAVQAWSVWSKKFVSRVSYSKEVESVIALGSVLAIKLQDENSGYSSNAAAGLQKKLLVESEQFKIHVRVLGNVLYVMASLTSKPETLRSIEKSLLNALS